VLENFSPKKNELFKTLKLLPQLQVYVKICLKKIVSKHFKINFFYWLKLT